MHKLETPNFPNDKTFERFGGKSDLVQVVRSYCARHAGFEDVDEICRAIEVDEPPQVESDDGELEVGYVYLALMKIGREKRYKIGKADIVGRRTKQIAVQLPEDLELIHAISTDDAYGIEAYWHRRFAEKRRGGEWFDLIADDVRAFRRRKLM